MNLAPPHQVDRSTLPRLYPRMRYLLASALILAGCSSSGVLQRSPTATYQSDKAREQVVDCLMNRQPLAYQPELQELPDGTGVTWGNGAVTHWGFIVRDQGSGSTIDMIRTSSMGPGLRLAETCF